MGFTLYRRHSTEVIDLHPAVGRFLWRMVLGAFGVVALLGLGAVVTGWLYVWATTGDSLFVHPEVWRAPVETLVTLLAVGLLFAPLEVVAAFFGGGLGGDLAFIVVTLLLGVLWVLERRRGKVGPARHR